MRRARGQSFSAGTVGSGLSEALSRRLQFCHFAQSISCSLQINWPRLRHYRIAAMKKRIQIKPSKSMGAAQMIGGIIFTIIGVAVVIPMMSKEGGPVWFGFLWTGAALIGAVMGAINAFTEEGIPTEEIVSEGADLPKARSTEDRLRELDEMHRKKVISATEFAEARKRILEEH
jgi:hypothetical protein